MLVDMYEVSKRDILGIESCFSFYLAFLTLHGMVIFFKDKYNLLPGISCT